MTADTTQAPSTNQEATDWIKVAQLELEDAPNELIARHATMLLTDERGSSSVGELRQNAYEVLQHFKPDITIDSPEVEIIVNELNEAVEVASVANQEQEARSELDENNNLAEGTYTRERLEEMTTTQLQALLDRLTNIYSREQSKLDEMRRESIQNSLNSIEVGHEGIKSEPDHASTTQTEDTKKVEAPASALSIALSSMLSRRKSPDDQVSIERNNEKVLQHQEGIIQAGSSFDATINACTEELEKALAPTSTPKELSETFKSATQLIGSAKQDLILATKNLRYANTTEQLVSDAQGLKANFEQFEKLTSFVRNNASSLNMRNDLLEPADKIDFHKIADQLAELAKTLSQTLSEVTKTLEHQQPSAAPEVQ